MTLAQPIVVLTAADGSSVRIDTFPVVLGRSHPGAAVQPDCDIGPLDPTARVSRQHAVIELRDGGLVVSDLGSANGTAVDGHSLSPHQPRPLGDHAQLVLGDVRLAVEVDRPASPPTPPPSPAATMLFDPAPPPAAPAPAPPPPPPAPVPVAAPARLTVDAAAGRVLAALADERTTHAVLRPDRAVHLRRDGEWAPIEDGGAGADAWAPVWRAVCALVGIGPQAGGHVVARVGEALVAEAFLPPLTLEPVLVLERRPPRLTLDQMAAEGLCDSGAVQALLTAVGARRGILVAGPRDSGRTRVLESLVDALPRGDRVAVVEPRPGIRVSGPLAVRLAPPPETGEGSVAAALAVRPDWIVLDDATPAALGAAVARGFAAGAVPICAVRGDAAGARDEAARELVGPDGDMDAARRRVDGALPVTVRLERAAAGFRIAGVDG